MAKAKTSLPKDIAVGISKLSEAVGKDKNILLKEMKDIISTNDAIRSMENMESKIRFAWTILASKYSRPGGTYYILPLSTPRVRKIESTGKFVGDLYCMAQEVKEGENGEEELGELFYASGTFWEDNAKKLRGIQSGKPYKAKVLSREQKKGITIYGDAEFEEANHEFPDIKEFFKDHIMNDYEEIMFTELDINEAEYDTDLRILRITVMKTEEREGDKGEYAYYEVIDDSILGHRTERIFVEPCDLIYDQSSLLFSVGTVSISKDGRVRWNSHFIVPEIPVERITTVTPSDDTVDLDMEEPEEEEPKEPEAPKDKPVEPAEEESEDIFEA